MSRRRERGRGEAGQSGDGTRNAPLSEQDAARIDRVLGVVVDQKIADQHRRQAGGAEAKTIPSGSALGRLEAYGVITHAEARHGQRFAQLRAKLFGKASPAALDPTSAVWGQCDPHRVLRTQPHSRDDELIRMRAEYEAYRRALNACGLRVASAVERVLFSGLDPHPCELEDLQRGMSALARAG